MLRQPYFFVYSYAEIEGRNFRNRLDFPAEKSYNPNAPGERRICRIPRERFRYDHMFDHNRLWRTWKQRRKERRRASFPERKGPNVVHAHVTPSSSSRLGARCRRFESCHSDQRRNTSNSVATPQAALLKNSGHFSFQNRTRSAGLRFCFRGIFFEKITQK